MTRRTRTLVLVALGVAVAVVLGSKGGARAPAAKVPEPPNARRLVRLVDLGAGKCIPCKAMAPILEELRSEYAGRMDVEIIDVWQNPGAGAEHGVRMIPTQIFYAADGRELARHEGFMAKAEILEQWKAVGVQFKGLR